ncbi:MAG: LamG-like jellyroll fold domain-containing protein [Sedimentisphaeraceae bacterium JB056]
MKKILFVLIFASLVMASDPNLVSHWKFDEEDGTVASDSQGFYNLDVHGTVSAGNWQAGKFGNSIHLDGTSNFVGLGSGSVYDFGGFVDMTIAFWVKLDTIPSPVAYIFDNSYSGYKSNLVIVGGDQIRIQSPEGDVTGPGGVLQAEVWHHIAFVAKNTDDDGLFDLEVYIDGQFYVAKRDLARNTQNRFGWAAFGANAALNGGNNFLSGSFDDLRIYDKPMVTQDVVDLYNETVDTGFDDQADLMSHWKLDQTDGTTVYDSLGFYNLDVHGEPNDIWQAGNFGNGIATDGATNYIGFGTGSVYDFGGFDNMTIAFWLKLDSVTGPTACIWDNSYSGYKSNLYLVGGDQIRVQWQDGYLTGPAGILQADTWHHVAFISRDTDDDGLRDFEVYVDGEFYISKTDLPRDTTGKFGWASFGASGTHVGGANFLDGSFDDIRIYSKPLNTWEVSSLYDTVVEPMTAFDNKKDLELYWRFDETAGVNIADSSGRDIYGKMFNDFGDDSQWVDGIYGNAISLVGNPNDGTQDQCVTFDSYNNQYAFGPFSDKTLTMWIQPQVFSGVQFLLSTSVGEYRLYLYLYEDKVALKYTKTDGATPQIVSSTPLVIGNWYHIALVSRELSSLECTMQVYLNGESIINVTDAKTFPSNRINNMSFFGHIASSATADHSSFEGLADELRIYGYPMDFLQVQEIYSYGSILAGDINRNCVCDQEDLAITTELWLGDTTDVAATESMMEDGDFESYADQAALESDWADNGLAASAGATTSSTVTLLTNPADTFSGSKAMRWTYDCVDTSGSAIHFTELIYTLGSSLNLSQYDQMILWIKPHVGNSLEDAMYIKFLDGGTSSIDAKAFAIRERLNGSTSQVAGQWQQWVIDLNNLLYNVDGIDDLSQLTDIRGLYLGCYSGAGQGVIDIDDITLVSNSQCSMSVEADINGDCIVDLDDYSTLASDWLKSSK